MSSWIHSKPIEQITWADLEALITDGVTEGQQIEFKREIETPDGKPDIWVTNHEKGIGRYGKAELCKVVSAFLNSYGGTLFLGVDEEKESSDGQAETGVAKELKPLPRAILLAQRFEAVLGSMDPPATGIAVQPILNPLSSDGSGVLVFRVQQSSQAPHGFGKPSEAYIRRGASTQPMSMRDLQSAFWETRNRAEWVHQTRQRFDTQRRKLMLQTASVFSGEVGFDNPTLHWKIPGIVFRISAIPQGRLTGLKLLQWQQGTKGQSIRPHAHEMGFRTSSPYRGGVPERGWRLKGQGLWAKEDLAGIALSLLEIEETGSVSISSFLRGTPIGDSQIHIVDYEKILVPLGQIIVMAEVIRRHAGQPHVPVEIDFNFSRCGEIYANSAPHYLLKYNALGLFDYSEVEPITFTKRSEMNLIFTEMERHIAAACGVLTNEVKAPTIENAIIARERDFMPVA